MSKLVIFDLDGTLIDSLGDIADSMNEVLATLGYPTHPEDAYRTKVGDGVGNLVLRSLPPGTVTPQRVEDCKIRMREAYAKRLTRRTRPYPGIVNMLVGVRERGARVAVFSNKPDPASREICAVLFNGHPFAFVLGATATIPLKPDPAGVHHILKATTTEPAETLYVGDTNTDMKTGRAAGVRTIGVTWGFRAEAELTASGADAIIHRPEELLNDAFFA